MNRIKFLLQVLARFGKLWLTGKSVKATPLEKPESVSFGIMPVAAYRHDDSEKIDIKPGDKIHLNREPKNKSDRDAIAVYIQGHKIGYIPRRYNHIIAALMDQKAVIDANIAHINQEEEAEGRIWVEVTMRVSK